MFTVVATDTLMGTGKKDAGSLAFDGSIEPLSELWDHLPPDFW